MKVNSLLPPGSILIPTFFLLYSLTTLSYADDLGLLLTSPTEREQLRHWRINPKHNSSEPTQANNEFYLAPQVYFNGMIKNNNGKSHQWANGQWVDSPEAAKELGILYQGDGGTKLGILPDSSNQPIVFLKPGQVHNRQSGTTLEKFEAKAPPLKPIGEDIKITQEARKEPPK